MNGRNKGERICLVLCYGKEPVFKRSLVSPLCRYIVTYFWGNARWETVQNDGKVILQNAETVDYA